MSRYKIEGSIVFDTKLYTLTLLDSANVRLSQKEAEVLVVLCIYSGQTVSRQFLFDNAWPSGTGSDGHLNRIILLLRRKFDAFGFSDAIKTIPKVGYVLSNCTQCINNDDAPSLTEKPLGFTLGDNISSQFNLAMNPEAHGMTGEEMGKPSSPLNDEHHSLPPITPSPKKTWTRFHKKLKVISIKFQGRWRYLYIYLTLTLALLIVGYITGFAMLFEGHITPKSKYTEVESEIIKNISLNSDSTTDEVLINKAKKLLVNWSNDAFGKYYISLSPRAVSILHFSENNVPLSKRIFLSQGNDIISLLSCALDSESRPVSTAKVTDDNVGSINSNKGTIIRRFTTELIAGCEVKSGQYYFKPITLVVTMVINDGNNSNSANKSIFFHSDFKVWNYNDEAVLNIGLSGGVSTRLIFGKLYDIWLPKEKTVRAFDSGAQAELEPVLNLMTDLITRDEFFSSIEIDEGVYYIDLLGGVLISAK